MYMFLLYEQKNLVFFLNSIFYYLAELILDLIAQIGHNLFCSIPFSAEDIDKAIPAFDPSDIELPIFLSEYPSGQFLIEHQK